MGYLRGYTWPFEGDELERTENRIYQQLTLKHNLGRAGFEHRYRLEQRWLNQADNSRFSSRVRYRLQITTPLNRQSMEAGAIFVNVYDEIFINFDDIRSFDQNRLYVAGGYQFTSNSNLQLGLLWQARTSEDFFRVQIFYTHNFDLRR